ncbi:MAG TPA: thioredoxin fold domain-containing protein [Ramlibacter sp.]|nr:thioredoxin fold domain-containing protein [Ramlibacter sp.]
MNKTSTLFALAAVAALVSACSKEAPAPASAPAAPAPAAAATPATPPATAQAGAAAAQSSGVSTDAIASEAQGFTVGPTMSARTVYVFFDAQCPHCSAQWYAAKPLKPQAKFVWIPVRLLNDNSGAQGAAILAAKDPAAAMDEHEAAMMDHKGGIKAASGAAAQEAAIKKNTDLFTRYQFASVPTLVTKNAQTGAVVTHEGALKTEDLAAFVGVPVPAK